MGLCRWQIRVLNKKTNLHIQLQFILPVVLCSDTHVNDCTYINIANIKNAKYLIKNYEAYLDFTYQVASSEIFLLVAKLNKVRENQISFYAGILGGSFLCNKD